MQKIKDLIISNRLEILSIVTIFIFFILLNIFYGNQTISILIDIGHEAYFPEQILKGKILYKDLFNIYGPLSYQINAIYYKIFGISLNTLQIAGSINALIITYLLYAISRIFTSKLTSFAIVCFILVSCIYCPWTLNYIYAYSYAMVYAFCMFLFSLIFLLLYLKIKQEVFIPLSWFFAGCCLAFKYDYVPYIILLFIFTIIIIKNKKISKKNIFFSLTGFLIVPVLSFSILFLQGLTLNELLNRFIEIKNYAFSQAQQFLYLHKSGLYPQKEYLEKSFYFFKNNLGCFFILLTLIYTFLKFNKKGIINILKSFLILSFIFIALFFFYYFTVQNLYYSLCWLPLFFLGVFIFILFNRFILKKRFFLDNIFLIFMFIIIISSIRATFFLMFNVYGIFSLPLLLIACSIFTVEIVPNLFKSIERKYIERAFVVIIFIMTMHNIIVLEAFAHNRILLKTERGFTYKSSIFLPDIGMIIGRSEAIALNETINYIKTNLKGDESIWVIPEGVIINFLTNHPSKSIYDTINPPYMQGFGEHRIINDIKSDPPDYIIINTRNTEEYGYKYLCSDYGFEVCKYIKSSYNLVKIFDSYLNEKDFYNMFIYKRK